MRDKVVVKLHSEIGYFFDVEFQRSRAGVPDIPSLGINTSSGRERKSVFEDVKVPAYKKQHNVFHDYSIGRSSPGRFVTKAARRAITTDRLNQLSRPRRLPPMSEKDSKLPAAMKGLKEPRDLQRLERLAKPKPIHQKHPNHVERVLSGKNIPVASPRVDLLAMAKPVSAEFRQDKALSTRVKPAVLKAIASPRTEQLSKPINRPIGQVLIVKEDAFDISPAALKAKPSNRVTELALPQSRYLKDESIT